MDFIVLKAVHVICVVASYILFFVRGVWMMSDSPRLRQHWVRVVPHLIDTALLASAVTMAVMIRQYPFVAGWLTAKVVALVVYIGLGVVALRAGKTRRMRIAAWILAQMVFAYIVAVAITRSVTPWSAY
jgi:uncharacterized membrane protein SirB2